MVLTTNAQAAQAAGGMSGIILFIYVIGVIAFFYFVLIRPQKKEQKRVDALLSSMAIGDSVMTTSGFYGVIIDIDEEDQTVVVEFGSNKNCRIIMNKTAIAQVEKAN
ncbi:MAG: preprotein translocase subunit YajC [Lachnospiraceae bacterium]|nr:preprotein translocase subunit YajC [Lachnospiraceae bacterium]